MKGLLIKKAEGANPRPYEVNRERDDYSTRGTDISIDIRIQINRPRCKHCGKRMVESPFYRGGRGYAWAWHCEDWCSEDKGIIDITPGGE